MISREIKKANVVSFVKIRGQSMKHRCQNLINVAYVVSSIFYCDLIITYKSKLSDLSVHSGCRYIAMRCYPCDPHTTHKKLTSSDLQQVNCSGNTIAFNYYRS
jgi:hypothetical protein